MDAEVCERLKWYLRLCEGYTSIDRVSDKHDKYMSRYLVAALYVMVFSNTSLYSKVKEACPQEIIAELKDLGGNFLVAKYSCVDDATVLKFIRHLCTCLVSVIEMDCGLFSHFL